MSIRRDFPTRSAAVPVRPWLLLLAQATFVLQGLHVLEHLSQVVQKFVLGWEKAHGLLGFLDLEAVHLLYNSGYFALLLVLFFGVGFHRRSAAVWQHWSLGSLFVFGVVFQGYHEVEHLFKFNQHLATMTQGTPGILGNFFNLIWLHFSFNLVALVPILVLLFGYRLRAEPRPAVRPGARGLPVVAGGAQEPRWTRRTAILGIISAALGGGGLVYGLSEGAQRRRTQWELQDLREEEGGMRSTLARLEERVGRLSQRWVASGGGTNLKHMPGASGEQIELREVFSFDRNHAYCRVDTNPAAFAMPTNQMGTVLIPANGFYMAMSATSIEQTNIEERADGKTVATMRGVLDCHTEVVTASVRAGSRTAAEPASYEIVAVDGGVGGGIRGDSFAFTVFFDEKTAPLNHAIFGPRFTFTGDMVEGEITIQSLARLVP